MGSMKLALIEKAVTIRAVYTLFLYGQKRSLFHFIFLYFYTRVSPPKPAVQQASDYSLLFKEVP